MFGDEVICGLGGPPEAVCDAIRPAVEAGLGEQSVPFLSIRHPLCNVESRESALYECRVVVVVGT